MLVHVVLHTSEDPNIEILCLHSSDRYNKAVSEKKLKRGIKPN